MLSVVARHVSGREGAAVSGKERPEETGQADLESLQSLARLE